MKEGTILKNPWASNDNPTQVSFYWRTEGKFFKTICFYKGIHISTYYKSDLDKFEILGYSNALESMKQELESYRKAQGDVTNNA